MKPRLAHELVRGTPIDVDGRIFEPEARVTTLIVREATLGTHGTNVVGVRFARIRPTALIEHTPHGERRHRIEDPNRRALLGFFAIAAILPLMLNALAHWLGAVRK